MSSSKGKELAVKIHQMKGSDGTLDPKLERKKKWQEIHTLVTEILDEERKREECTDHIAEQGQVLGAFAHALVRAALSGSKHSTRLAYQDLMRYCKVLREE